MSLSFDTARCTAHKPYGIPAVPCRDCQPYTETVHGERQPWMTVPPPFTNGTYAYRIAPEGEKND